MKPDQLMRFGTAHLVSVLAIMALILGPLMTDTAAAQSVRPPGDATVNMTPGDPDTSRPPQQFRPGPQAEEVFGQTQGDTSRTDFWSILRHGGQGYTAVEGPQSGYAIQSTGEAWRQFRNGELATWGWWGLAGITAICLIYYLFMGPVRIEGGRSGKVIERFALSERTGHWLTAIAFLALAVTGLNMLYGRNVLLPIMGPEAFASMAQIGKYTHFVASFIFMVGLLWITAKWIRANIPDWTDIVWLAKGGGFFSKKGHFPPSKKFNAGQKIIFWLVLLGGISTSLSGIALLIPFEFAMFSKTFAAVNSVFGTDLRSNFTAIEEMQLHQLWHAMIGLFLMAVMVAHIYIGTIGMEGGFEAMGSGKVDLNWAKEHHSLWVEKLEEQGALQTLQEPAAPPPPSAQQQPAE